MCTLIAKKNTDGWVVASNSDNPYSVRSQLICSFTVPYSYVAVRVNPSETENNGSVPWAGMLTRGVNAVGLSFTYAYVQLASPGKYPPQNWTAELLSEQADCSSAVRFMERSHTDILPGNYLLADREGQALIVEVASDGIGVIAPYDGALTCTNVWEDLSEPLAKNWRNDTASDERADFARNLVVGSAPHKLAQDVLASHQGGESDSLREKGGSMCNHGRTEGTISSEVLEPGSNTLWWNFGWPCGNYQGHEAEHRYSWGRYFGFKAEDVKESAELTTPNGEITAVGASLTCGVRL